MGEQKAFFLSEYEILQRDHPEKFSRKTSSKKAPRVYDCSTCGLAEKCRSPKMERYWKRLGGKARKGILVVGLCPGRVEDKEGLPFVGRSGELAERMFGYVGVNFTKDCDRTNIVQCYPGTDKCGKDKSPTREQIKCCHERLERDIQEVNPKMIVCFGAPAINEVLQPKYLDKFTAAQMHGKVIPCHRYGCWVGCSFHPAFFLHRKGEKELYPDDETLLGYDLANIVSYLDESLPQPLTSEGNECILDPEEAVNLLYYFCDSEKPVAFDYETTCLSSYDEKADILSISLTNDVNHAIFIPVGLVDDSGKNLFAADEQAAIALAMKDFLKSDAPKVVQNVNMEELWGRKMLNQPMNNYIHDTMIAAHVVNCSRHTTSLGFQAYEMTGHEYKGIVNVEDLLSEPLEKVCDRNCWDSRYTLMSYSRQKRVFEKRRRLGEFYQLFHRGSKVLVNLKERGVRIDVDALNKLEEEYSSEQKTRMLEIRKCSEVGKYEERTGREFNFDSPPQLREILYKGYKIEKRKRTPTHQGSVDEEALRMILDETKNEEVRGLINSVFRFRKTCSLLERVANYRKVMDKDGYIHPTYNLNIAETFRSSASDPNIQNVFERDEELRVFKKCIVPSPGNVILESDYTGIEVCVIAMESKDPKLSWEIKNGVDTHRKWAARIFSEDEGEAGDERRYRAKNGFVFPCFYKAAAKSVARAFPEVLKEHVLEVWKEFWEEYHYVKEWQDRKIHDYVSQGYVEGLSGFRRYGPLTTKQICNTPIQGTAFHLLLDSLDRSDVELVGKKFKTVPFWEVHDSIGFDTVPSEGEDVMSLVTDIMCSRRFEWQGDIPLSVKWKLGINWYETEKVSV